MGQSELPIAGGRQHAAVLSTRFGWIVRREGEHIVLTHPAVPNVNLSIPNHKQVSRALLQKQLRRAGISDREYRRAFDTL